MISKLFIALFTLSLTTPALAIRNGVDTSLEQTPWQVSLQMADRRGGWHHFCGGSIIEGAGRLEKRLIITAAHCVDMITPQHIQRGAVRVAAGGRSGLKSDLREMPAIQRIYYHSTYLGAKKDFEAFIESIKVQYLALKLKNAEGSISMDELHMLMELKEIIRAYGQSAGPTLADIAVIILEDDMPFGSTIQPVDLDFGNTVGEDHSKLFGKKVLISGWGRTLRTDSPNQLQSAKVYISDCTKKSVLCSDYVATKAHTQVYVENKKVGPWQGDSGGPAVTFNKELGIFQLFGVTSYGAADLKTAGVYGGFYTKISAYIGWLFNIISDSRPRNAKEISARGARTLP